MKHSYLGALLIFILAVGAIALLSMPRESTRIALYLDNQKLRRAETLLWKHYQRYPQDLASAAKLVDTLRAMKENQRAKEVIQEVLTRNPDNVEWRRKLAFILLAEKNPGAAAKVLPPAERDRAFWTSLASVYHDTGSYALAEKSLASAFAGEADKEPFWRTLALWRGERGDRPGEKEALEAALRLAPEDEELLGHYFFNRYEAKDFDAALAAIDKLPRPLEREYLQPLFELYRAQGDYQAARTVLEELAASEDATMGDSLALASLLYLQKDLAQAQAVFDKVARQASAFPPAEREMLLSQASALRGIVAELAERENASIADSLALVSLLYLQKDLVQARALLATLARQAEQLPPAAREALLSQSRTVWAASLLQAARNGNEEAIFKEIDKLNASPASADVIRDLIYACLGLSDFYASAAANGASSAERSRSGFWLRKAVEIYDKHKSELPLAAIANARLAADLAERRQDWQAMLQAWRAAGGASSLPAQLGIARALQHLGNYEASWQSLRRAETLAATDADLLQVALQAQALAAALPKDERQQVANMARKSLAKGWNDSLARALFFSELQSENLGEAGDLLRALASRGLAGPEEYIGLAEAQVAMGLRGQRGGAARVAAGKWRDGARNNALLALATADADLLPPLLYVFTAIDDRAHVREILKRPELARLPQTPQLLRQLADAYACLGDNERQSELLEKRARVSGRAADWLDAIDSRYWRGDYPGALRLVDAAEASLPQNPSLVERRLLALVDMGRYSQAERAYLNARDSDPALDKKLAGQGLAALGLAYDKNGSPGRARHFYQLALQADPADERAAFGMAEISRREGKAGEAARVLRSFLEKKPDNLWARANLAGLDQGGSRRQYEKILAAAPQNTGTSARAAQALALWRTGHLQKALRLYAGLMDAADRTAPLMTDYAQALIEAGRPGQAKRILDDAIRAFPGHIPAYRVLASVYLREQNYRSAEACLRKAMRLAPGDAALARDLAWTQQAQNKFWSAQKNWSAGGAR